MAEKYDITITEGITGAKPKKAAKRTGNRGSSWFYISVVGQIGYTIAIPLALGAFVGSLLGNALIGLGIGVVISIAGFVKIIKKLL